MFRMQRLLFCFLRERVSSKLQRALAINTSSVNNRTVWFVDNLAKEVSYYCSSLITAIPYFQHPLKPANPTSTLTYLAICRWKGYCWSAR